MSPTDCHALMSVCRPQLYQDNPFHLLGLPVDATARDIRRRQEDLKAAEDSGAWDGEFGHLLAGRKVPTPHEVNETFALLHDPERRVVEELFWFWPTEWGKGKQDEAIQGILRGKREASFELWNSGATSAPGAARSVARHNLAVMYHLYAIRYETVLLEGQELSDDASQRMASYWKQLIAHWNELGDDDAFWEVIANRVRGLDDPRLTTGFVRRMRQTLPQAFDKINAILAVEHARKGNGQHARRHLMFMRETHEGLDDVERTISEILAPLEKSVQRLVEQAAKEARIDAKKGLRAARELMAAAQEQLETVKGLLDDGRAIRTQLSDTVATTCLGCLIEYGNATKDWGPCIALLKKAEALAVTKSVKTRISENITVAKENEEARNLNETCWFCKHKAATESGKLETKMYGDVTRIPIFNGTRLQWRNVTVAVPRCDTCKAAHSKNGGAVAGGLAGAAAGTAVLPVIGSLFGFVVGALLGSKVDQKLRLPAGVAAESSKSEFPRVSELLREGWVIGEKPS